MVHRYGPVPECSIPIAKTEWAPEWNLQGDGVVRKDGHGGSPVTTQRAE
jgi:hypothetical protein